MSQPIPQQVLATFDERLKNPDTQSGAFTIHDSGTRHVYEGGMQRDITEDKVDYLLVRDGPMYERWAEHMRKGALKYGKRNWMRAISAEEKLHALESANRHLEKWMAAVKANAPMDEDHAAAVFFNIDLVEFLADVDIRFALKPEVLDAKKAND